MMMMFLIAFLHLPLSYSMSSTSSFSCRSASTPYVYLEVIICKSVRSSAAARFYAVSIWPLFLMSVLRLPPSSSHTVSIFGSQYLQVSHVFCRSFIISVLCLAAVSDESSPPRSNKFHVLHQLLHLLHPRGMHVWKPVYPSQ